MAYASRTKLYFLSAYHSFETLARCSNSAGNSARPDDHNTGANFCNDSCSIEASDRICEREEDDDYLRQRQDYEKGFGDRPQMPSRI